MPHFQKIKSAIDGGQGAFMNYLNFYNPLWILQSFYSIPGCIFNVIFQLQSCQPIDNETRPEGDKEAVFVKIVWTEGYRLSDLSSCSIINI